MPHEPPRQKWTARIVLLLAGLGGLAWLGSLDLAKRVSTDVLDLIPAGQSSPELAAVRELAGEEQGRVLLIALRVPARSGESEAVRRLRAEGLAAQFARNLAAFPAIASALPLSDPAAGRALATVVYENRMRCLLPAWLAHRRSEYEVSGTGEPFDRWLAQRSASDLEAFLAKPEAAAAQGLVTSDPLLLVPSVLERMGGLGGAGFGQGSSADQELVWAQSSHSALEAEGQHPVFEALERAFSGLLKADPQAGLRWTGVARFAAASRERIEREFGVLNTLSLVCVLGVTALCIRRPYRAVLLIPVVAGSLLGAWVATTAAWPRVHVLVFVLGSLLSGVAIDYGFYFCLQPLRRPDEPYRERARRLVRPLLASALTTVIGFSFLLASELPLIRQLGVFVSAGLVCAVGAAFLWFAQLDDSHLEARSVVRRNLQRPVKPAMRACARAALVLGAAVALVGPWLLHWKDDIRELEIPAPGLQENDSRVRALFGESGATSVYLTHGADLAQARLHLESFLAWHARAFPDTAVATLGLVLPTEEQWRRAPVFLDKLGSFPALFRAALSEHGFDPDSFGPFFAAWAAAPKQLHNSSYETLVHEITGALKGPSSLLAHIGAQGTWFATIAGHPAGEDPPGSSETVGADELGKLNRLFASYRLSALRLSSAGLGFVGLSVFAIYGLMRGPRIFAVPAGACLFTFGVLGLCGATLNLFHLLGAFLGVCLSHNYAIFTAESAAAGEEPPPSVRMSAAAAASSFGVLALSRIPVVAALGSTVALTVLSAVAILELAKAASSRS